MKNTIKSFIKSILNRLGYEIKVNREIIKTLLLIR